MVQVGDSCKCTACPAMKRICLVQTLDSQWCTLLIHDIKRRSLKTPGSHQLATSTQHAAPNSRLSYTTSRDSRQVRRPRNFPFWYIAYLFIRRAFQCLCPSYMCVRAPLTYTRPVLQQAGLESVLLVVQLQAGNLLLAERYSLSVLHVDVVIARLGVC